MRKTATMRAAVIESPETVRIVETEIPEPGPGEVRVRVEGCGVCASNLPVWEGRSWFEYPREPGSPGHEGWGIVDWIGEGVSFIAPGDRVTFLSGHAYAEYDVVPAVSTVPLPARLGGMPFPGEPLGCAMNVLYRSGVRPGKTVAVVGMGFLGIVLTALARDRGCQVIALSRRRSMLEFARSYGAGETVLIDGNEAAVRAVMDMTGGRGCDTVLETTGYQKPLDLASEIAVVRGRLVIAGYHQDGSRTVNMQLWNWRGLDVINAHERDPSAYLRGMEEAVSAVATGVLDPLPLFTHTYALDDLQTAFVTLREGVEGFVKALIMV